MIEILFSDSACGSLKMAQHMGKGKYLAGAVGVIITHEDGSKPTKEEVELAQSEALEKAQLRWERATPMGGITADIYGFNLILSVGDIYESLPGIKRKQTIEHLYSIYPSSVGEQAAEDIIRRANENLKAIQERTANGESIRIWVSNQPDEMCGLYWFLDQLNQWNIEGIQITLVKLPEWETSETGHTVRKNSWAEVAPEDWVHYLDLQQNLPPTFIQGCAVYWKTLQEENAPLRAILNGQLASMPENIYDDFILREIALEAETFHEARLIGRILGKYQLGIGDAWIALRIENMIKEGKLESVSTSDTELPIYHRGLKKT